MPISYVRLHASPDLKYRSGLPALCLVLWASYAVAKRIGPSLGIGHPELYGILTRRCFCLDSKLPLAALTPNNIESNIARLSPCAISSPRPLSQTQPPSDLTTTSTLAASAAQLLSERSKQRIYLPACPAWPGSQRRATAQVTFYVRQRRLADNRSTGQHGTPWARTRRATSDATAEVWQQQHSICVRHILHTAAALAHRCLSDTGYDVRYSRRDASSLFL